MTYSLAVPSADSGLAEYLREIRDYPILSVEDERDLAERVQADDDKDAQHRLVTSHLRLVAKMALRYGRYGLPVADLISEGNLGLLRAIQSFHPDRGCRLSTYAMWWIRAALNQYVLNNWSIVRLGTVATQKKLFFNLRRLKAKLNIIEEQDLTPDNVQRLADVLHAPADEVRAMNYRLAARDGSLNAPVSADQATDRQDLLIDDRPDAEELLAEAEQAQIRRTLLRSGLQILDRRELDILMQRRLRTDPPTLEELAGRYGISRERIRQLENRAFQKLRAAILATAESKKKPDPRSLARPASSDAAFALTG